MFETTESEDNKTLSTSESESNAIEASENNDELQTSDTNQSSVIVKHQEVKEVNFKMILREIIFCIALTVTTYGALHNSPPRISRHPQPISFFSETSLVKDWFKGQLAEPLSDISHADVSVVMYYAPWDAESQHMRHEFDEVANVMGKNVYFAAINCWNPESECRMQHDKIPSWPVVMAYTTHSKAVMYRGPHDAHSLMKFINLIINPLDRISSAMDLVNLIAVCDVIVVGYTPLSESSKYYNMFYNVALKSREHDPLGEVCFAVVTSDDLAHSMGVSYLPSVRLVMWNGTTEFAGEAENMSETQILQWIWGGISRPVNRVTPMGHKSFSLHRYIGSNPALILFTPLNPLYQQMPAYDLLREVAIEYYNCNNSAWSTEVGRLQYLQRVLYQHRIENITSICRNFQMEHDFFIETPQRKAEIATRYIKTVWRNNTETKTLNSKSFISYLLKKDYKDCSIDAYDMLTSEVFHPVALEDDRNCAVDVCEGNSGSKCFGDEYCEPTQPLRSEPQLVKVDVSDRVKTSLLTGERDPYSAQNLQLFHMRSLCQTMTFAEKLNLPIFPIQSSNYTRVAGLSCKLNKTLNFIAIDSIRHHHFAESLGIDIRNRKKQTAVIILDGKSESQFELMDDYGEKSLRDFILNYTSHSLNRNLRTLVENTKYTHYYRSEEPGVNPGERKSGKLRILQLTTETFKRYINNSNKPVMVMVCAGGCPSHVSRTVIESWRMLQSLNVSTEIARLDGLRHDLPWEFTVSKFPTILIFPENRQDSLMYPENEKLDTESFLTMISRVLDPAARLRLQLHLCSLAKGKDVKRQCLEDMRYYVVTLIGNSLKHWRRVNDRRLRKSLLQRLQALRHVSVSLGLLHFTNSLVGDARQLDFLQSLDNLRLFWNSSVYDKKLARHTPLWKSKSL